MKKILLCLCVFSTLVSGVKAQTEVSFNAASSEYISVPYSESVNLGLEITNKLMTFNIGKNQIDKNIEKSIDLTSLQQPDLVSYYQFKNGLASDKIVTNNDKLFNASTKFTTGSSLSPPGNALNFNGSNNYVSATGYNVGTSNFTLEAWINPTTYTQSGILCQGGYSYALGFLFDFNAQGQGSLRLETGLGGSGGGTVYANGVITLNKWQHVAVSVTRGAAGTSLTKLYVNGLLVASGDIAANNIGNTTLNIGRITNTGNYFPGKIDEVRIWNTARTQSDIQNNMYNIISPSSTGLVAYYNFDTGIASGSNAGFTTLTDQTSNHHDGTLNNFSLTGSTSNWVESYAMVVPTPTAATLVSSTGFTANWTAPVIGIVTNYSLEVATNPNFTTPITGSPFSIASPTLTKTITGLSSVNTYYYRVTADKTSVTGQAATSLGIKAIAAKMGINKYGVLSNTNSDYVDQNGQIITVNSGVDQYGLK